MRRLSGPGAAVQVSERGGVEPVWAPDGRRLLYRTGRHLVVASRRPAARAVGCR